MAEGQNHDRERSMHNFKLILMSVMICMGCTQSSQDHTTTEAIDVQWDSSTAPTGPLTDQEITAFLNVVRKLPDGRPPEFSPSSLPRLTSPMRLDSAMQRLQQAIRGALTPQRQAETWLEDPELRNAFARMKVHPQAFATLMLRVSCAWSAFTVSRETSLLQARQQLDSMLAQTVDQLEHSGASQPAWKSSQYLQNLEELISLSEFLRLLESVPPESLAVMKRVDPELKKLFPKSEMAQEFARCVEMQSSILRASHQVPTH